MENCPTTFYPNWAGNVKGEYLAHNHYIFNYKHADEDVTDSALKFYFLINYLFRDAQFEFPQDQTAQVLMDKINEFESNEKDLDFH